LTGKVERDRLRVAAMIEAAGEAKLDSSEGKATFLEAGKTQKAVLLDLIHFTESAERTSHGFKLKNPTIPWDRLSRLRNRGLVHDYTEVDLEDIWAFVSIELPKIRKRLDRAKFVTEKD